MTMFKCIESLEENPPEVYLEVTAILLKLVDNVLTDPSNPKYRKLRLGNKLVSTLIMPSIGAMECLFELGFQEGEDSLVLPPESTSVEKLDRFKVEMTLRRFDFEKKNRRAASVTPSVSGGRQSTSQAGASAQAKPATTPRITYSSNPFLLRLQEMSAMVLQYELESTKLKALSVVPLENINERVQTRLRQHQQQALKDGQPIQEASLLETIFFTELMGWFKKDFFQWVDSPKCPKCSRDAKFVATEWKEGDRVEVYKCDQCLTRVVFQRFNDAAKLLDSRKGRCGEWANAFTAVCRALGYDARFIYDHTDHVWTEVYLKSEERWVHCDPCECALDKPLLYEKGWGKKLNYVVAFSCHDVQDVTWRYSADHRGVMARRTLCSEQQLVQTLQELNTTRQAELSAARRKALAKRTLVELVQLMVPAVEREGDSEGRQSGSLSWRLARAETTLAALNSPNYVWRPTPDECNEKRMVVTYCAGTDQYNRAELKGWRAGVFEASYMFRKEEKDWKIVYLCRTEGSTKGTVSWRVDLSQSGLHVDQVEVRCASTTFESGKVQWLLCAGDKCVPVNNGGLKTSELRGASQVTLTATVSESSGDLAWQHAQLFRQPVGTSEPSLHLCLTLVES